MPAFEQGKHEGGRGCSHDIVTKAGVFLGSAIRFQREVKG